MKIIIIIIKPGLQSSSIVRSTKGWICYLSSFDDPWGESRLAGGVVPICFETCYIVCYS